MNQAIVKEKLYQRYIEPTKHKREDFIGVEIELPVLNMNREAVDFNAVHTVTKSFLSKFGFIVSGMDDEGNIYLAEDKLTGDTLSFDCSYNNL